MEAHEKSNSKLKEFKILFGIALAITIATLLFFLLLVNKYPSPSYSKEDSFAIGAFFGAFLAFSIVTGVIVFILSEKNKPEKEN